jgi:hypothetical protein
MSLKRKVEQLEEQLNRNGTPCPHLPPLLREFEADGTERDLRTYERFTPLQTPRDAVCGCGRPRSEIHIREYEIDAEAKERL